MKTDMKWLLRLVVCISFVLAVVSALADDWPQWLGPQRDGVWRESGILEKFPPDGPEVLWRAEVGAGYSGPAVANGRIYLTDRLLKPEESNPDNPFERGIIQGVERVLCFDEKTGDVLWAHSYDCPYNISYPSGPRATPVIDDGRVYSLGAEGHLKCLDAQSGEPVWSRQFKEDLGAETPMWGFAAHPLIDGERLICIVGGKDQVAVAFNKHNGEVIWKALSASEPGYAPPMIYESGGKRQLIIWHPEALNSLNPETGELYWSQARKVKSGLTVPTPRKWNNLLFVTSFYDGPMMMQLKKEEPTAKLLWKGEGKNESRTDGLHSIISTPFIEEGYIYGVCSYGQMRCLNAKTGQRIWMSLEPVIGEEARWANAFLIKQGKRFFVANEQGDLIIARLSPDGYEEIDRAHLIEPTNRAMARQVVWSHPAFANRCVVMRNDKEIIRVSLEKTP